MTRGNPGTLYDLDPEIDRTYHKLQKENKNKNVIHEHSTSSSIGNFDSSIVDYHRIVTELVPFLSDIVTPITSLGTGGGCVGEASPFLPLDAFEQIIE